MGILKAGAASIPVGLDETCYPNSEFSGQHDDVYVRVLILESEERFAFLSADMPSMFPGDVRHCKELLQEVAGVLPENSWITVNHSFSAPHTWGDGDNGQKDTMVPRELKENPELIEPSRRINRAYRVAYRQAVTTAYERMQEAMIGFGRGVCAVNVNRNMKTLDGWWQGVDHTGFADHSLTVVRVNRLDGEPIAILYNYSVQSSVTAGVNTLDGRKLISSDLPGAASAFVEQEYGGGCTAMFLCGATGDQSPLYKINYYETKRDGTLHEGHLGEAGFLLLQEQGRVLGGAVVDAAEAIVEYNLSPEIQTQRLTYVCQCQRRETDMGRMRPVHSYTFIPDGERQMTIDAVRIGDIAFVGLLPEMDGMTVCQIRDASPFAKTVVATFVNGNAKSMPQEMAYDLFQYGAMNSPFVKGSAELSRDMALKLLKSLR